MMNEQEQEQNGNQIRDGERVSAFVADEAVQRAFARLEGKYVQAWRDGATVEAREAAHARMCVVADLRIELQSVSDNGAIAKARRDRAGQR
jgi:hypothetical protein